MKPAYEGRRRGSDPLDYIKKDPNRHYVVVSKRTGEAHEYRGFSSQADYFEIARGFTPEDVDKKLLKNDAMLVMSCSKAEKAQWDAEGKEDTDAILEADTVSGRTDISGGDADVEVTQDEMTVKSITRRKRRSPVKRKTTARKTPADKALPDS